MSEITINALATIFIVALLVTTTAYTIWDLVTDMIDEIQEREERDEE